MKYCLKIFLLSLFLLIFALPTTGMAESEQTNDRIALDYKDIELTDLIKTVSELTGRNFIYDDTVKGKVTIISPESMTQEEAYQLFLSVLSVKGYTLVQSDKVNKIILARDAKQSNLPTSSNKQGENYVTQLLHLKHADAQAIATSVLQPLIPKTSNLSVYQPTNTLILTDSAANIARLIDIIANLDVPTGLDQLEVFNLQQADAETVAQIATTLFANQPTKRSPRAKATTTQSSQVIAYPRTNTLLAIASADEISLLRNLVNALDTPGTQSQSNINVYYLKYAVAEELAKSLNEIMLGTQKAAAKQKDPAAIEPLLISADKPTNSLLISASPADYNTLVQVIEKLDIQRKQVFVEALILELSMDATREIGAALQGAIDIDGESVILGTSNLNSGSVGTNSVGLSSFLPESNQLPSLLTQSVKGLMLGGLFNPITITAPDGTEMTVPAVSALLQLSQTSQDVNVLSAPQLLTSDNEEAEIVVGENVPVITSRLTDTGSTGLAQSVTVERQDAALTLRFTPQITDGDLVRLDVFQEITSVLKEDVNTGPTLNKRQLRNTVLAENGKTVALGGLIQTNVENNEFRVPLLSNIPLLGRLFRSSGTTTKKTNLLVFMTPRIIRNASELATITQRAQLSSQSLQTQQLRDAMSGESFLIMPEQDHSEAVKTHE